MSEAVARRPMKRASFPDKLLDGASLLWFVVMLTGQWVFLYYIASFYGPSTLSGDFAAWDTNPFLSHGYVAGDQMGNLAFAGHVLMAAIVVFGGTLQLVPQIRARAPWLHRWNGRVFLFVAVLVSLTGLWMDVTREIVVEGIAANFAISFNGVLVMVLAALAWRAAAKRDFTSHRRWALRAFMVINGVFFLRMIVFGYIMLAQAPPSELMFDVFTYLSYLLPLALVELYIRAREGPGIARLAMSGVVLASSLYMAVGIVGFSMVVVRTVLGGA